MQAPELVFFAIAILAAPLLIGKTWREILEALAEGLSNFPRSGPPGHPLPGDDAWIVTRRRRGSADQV